MRCRECGAELADDVRGCPACDADAGEALTALDLDDAELGIRTEDRYAYIPPGPQWIRRRVHHGSTRVPVAILAGLALAFVVGAWLQRPASDHAATTNRATTANLAVLHRNTGTSLLLLAPDGLQVLDVDRRDVQAGSVAELAAGPVTAAATSGTRVVLVVDHRAYVVPVSLQGAATPIGPAVDVYPSSHAGRVWLLTYPADGSVVARELDLTGVETTPAAALGGSTTARAAADDRLVIERLSADGARSLATWDPARPTQPPVTFRTDALFVAARGNVVASRPSDCATPRCDLFLDDLTTGRHRVIDNTLGGGGVVASAFTEDGRRLAILESDGSRSKGTLVDTTTGAATSFESAPMASNRPAVAWSHDGRWLFVATSSGTIDAVDRRGHAYSVSAPPVAGAALLTR